ncbi:E3 SUMO-protein ligase NSE2 [Pelomyxa schiedti]|nr:E3 SUMO-protein ligase NSE2 [Pelomyxa schiedti]
MEKAIDTHRQQRDKINEMMLLTTQAAVEAANDPSNDQEHLDRFRNAFVQYLEAERLLDSHIEVLSQYRHNTDEPDKVKWYNEKLAEANTSLSTKNLQADERYVDLEQQLQRVRPTTVQPSAADDEDVVAAPAVRSTTCPITKAALVNPYTRHTFSHDAIMELIGNKKVIDCPVAGCSEKIQKSTLQHDENMEYILKRDILVHTQQADDDEEYTRL